MYKVLLLLAVGASAANAAACQGTSSPPPPPPPTPYPVDEANCGTVKYNARIVGGQNADKHTWPWQAALIGSNGMFCGGTLISKRHVLTASHCLYGASLSDHITVRLGEHDATNPSDAEQNFNVEKFFMHENYNHGTVTHDIAVIKLAHDATLNSYAQPACLPESGSLPADGTTCSITGWGSLSYGGGSPNILQVVEVPIVNHATCKTNYTAVGNIDDTMFCAGREGKDACQGDSGGPLVCKNGDKWSVHGATSWGYGCATPGYPGVYARVDKFIDWIKGKMAL